MIDLNQADPQAIKALSRLREAEFQPIVRLIRSQLEGDKQKLVHARETDAIRRLQGRAEAFEDILRAVDESVEVVRRK